MASPVFIFNTLFLLLLGVTGVRADEFPLKQIKLLTWVVDYEPFWSPDGKQIVLISSRHGGMKVHVLDAGSSNNGSEIRQITFGEAEDDSPAWSLDGKKIAFVSVREGVQQIFVMNPNGAEVRQLTSGKAEYVHVTWSPDS